MTSIPGVVTYFTLTSTSVHSTAGGSKSIGEGGEGGGGGRGGGRGVGRAGMKQPGQVMNTHLKHDHM